MNKTWLKISLAASALGAFAPGAWAQQGHAHQHGVARLNVVVEGNRLALAFESPLENLVGFERAPRNDKEREALRAMEKQLTEAAALFALNAEGGCVPGPVNVKPPAFDELKGKGKGAQHAEIEVNYEFRCTNTAGLRELQVNLFNKFNKLRKVEARVAGLKKQSSANLTPTSRKLVF